jgi:hypothetical protein
MTVVPELNPLGKALERAARDELRAARGKRRLAVVLVVLAIGVPAAAVGAARVIGGEEVAQSMPAGAAIFEGRHALTDDGLTWQCYLGDAAVRHEIVDRGFLGQYAPEPGHG